MIEKDSPAEKGGLQISDLIIEVDGVKIKNSNELKNTIASIAPGKTVNITYERDKKIKNTKIKLEKMDGKAQSEGKNETNPVEGLTLMEITDKVKQQFKLPRDLEGVLVSDVKEDSKAEKIGFKEGDIILQIEQKRIASLKEMSEALNSYKKMKKRVVINRQNTRVMLVLQ
jgi:serine protease Do